MRFREQAGGDVASVWTVSEAPGAVRAVAGVVLVLGVVSAAATVVPARRATRVDPMLTLRAE